MFDTLLLPDRTAIRSRLFASVFMHCAAVVLLWHAPRIVQKGFSGIQVVHAFDMVPVMPSEPALIYAEPAVGETYHPAPAAFLQPASKGTVNEETQGAGEAEGDTAAVQTPPADIESLFRIGFTAGGAEAVSNRPLDNIPGMRIGAPDLSAPLPPENDHQREYQAVPRVLNARTVEPARLLKQIIPTYPPLARTARVQGVVIVDAIIDESGTLREMTVVDGHPMLINAALDALRDWRYSPAKLNGVPTTSSVRVTVHFKLEFR